MKHGFKYIALYVQKHITPCTVVITSPLVRDKPFEAPAYVKRVYCHCIYIHPILHITRLYRFLMRYKCLHGPLCPVRRRQSSRYWLCRAVWKRTDWLHWRQCWHVHIEGADYGCRRNRNQHDEEMPWNYYLSSVRQNHPRPIFWLLFWVAWEQLQSLRKHVTYVTVFFTSRDRPHVTSGKRYDMLVRCVSMP